jgi:hypothetical protein
MSHRNRILCAWVAAAILVQAAIVGLTLSHPIFCGAEGRAAVSGDPGFYFHFARRAMEGQVPYRDYLVEYPPLAMPVFLLPRLVASTFRPYLALFGLEMMAFNALAVWLMARQVADREGLRAVPKRLAWYTASFAALCPLLIGRYDLAPMAITYAAVVLWTRQRRHSNVAAGALTAVGVLMKIFPGVILAPALAWEAAQPRGQRGRGLVAFTLTLAVGLAAWFAIGQQGALDSLKYHTGRGLEIGSTYAGAAILGGFATGDPVHSLFSHCSNGVAGGWADTLSRIALPMQALALVLVAWRSWKLGPHGDPFRLAAASLLAFILCGKVLSPQYMIWLFPFIATLPGRDGTRARALFVLCCLLTTMLYPWAIHRLMRFEDWAVGLLVYRNVLLFGLWALLLSERAPALAAVPQTTPSPIPTRLSTRFRLHRA